LGLMCKIFFTDKGHFSHKGLTNVPSSCRLFLLAAPKNKIANNLTEAVSIEEHRTTNYANDV